MQTQPYNSMLPAAIDTPYGEQRGMTKAEAAIVINESYDPMDWYAVLNYGSAAYILGHDALALAITERAVTLNPCAAAWINLAVIHGSAGRPLDASYAAQAAHRAEPDNRTAATIYAESLLRLGKWRVGWSLFHNYYDSNCVSLFRHAIPEWSGENLRRKRLLVIEGGGFGDNFFFLRWLPELKRRGAHITYLCPASMCSLMAEQPYIDKVIPTSQGAADQDISVTDFDYFTPLLALGGKLNATSQDPWRGTYIRAPRVDRPKRQIGFCWQAAEAHLPRPFRSLSKLQSESLVRTLELKGIKVISLVPQDWERPGWDVTARLIGTCDNVITVDTGVAHLAAAMEIPTWVLLPGFSAWYYGVDSLVTPLYPSMRLFRNHVRGLDIAVSACIAALEAGA